MDDFYWRNKTLARRSDSISENQKIDVWIIEWPFRNYSTITHFPQYFFRRIYKNQQLNSVEFSDGKNGVERGLFKTDKNRFGNERDSKIFVDAGLNIFL